MLEIIRHPDLYQNPVGVVRELIGAEWPQAGGGKPVLIFPTQTLLEYWEEQLLPTFGSWGGVRFVLFDGLVRDLLQETRPDLSDLTPGNSVLLLRMIITELAQQGRIPYLAQAFPATGFFAALRQEINLLQRAGLEPASFRALVRGANQPLEELATVFERYQQQMNQLHLADGEEKLRLAVAECANATNWRNWRQLLVIGFTDFTPQQEALLHKLSDLVKVTVVFDHSVSGQQNLALPSLRCREKGKELVYSRPGKAATAETPRTLTYLQQNLWANLPPPSPPGPDGSIELLKVKGGNRHELAAVAVTLKRLLAADPTLTPDEIAVISPYPMDEAYQIFTLLGLPVTAQIRGSLAQEPAAKALLQPFRVLLSAFEWGEMVKYLRWGGIQPQEDLYRAEPPTTLADWRATLTQLYATEEEKADQCNALLDFLAEIPSQGTYGQFFQLCLDWLDQPLLWLNFLPSTKAATPLLQARYLQTSFLGKLRGLVQKTLNIVAPFADLVIGLPDFYLTLESFLAQEFTAQPTSWANGIRLITPTEARGLSFRISCVIGLNEGVVPRLTLTGWLLREGTIDQAPIAEILPSNREQLLRERLLFFYGLQTARERLILSCCQTNEEGEEVNPSSFWDDLVHLLPADQQIIEVESGNLLDPLRTVKTAGLEEEIKQKVQAELARIEGGRARNGHLGPEEARILRTKLSAKPFSISALEEYNTCPFQYFCRRWLQIEPLGEPEIIPSRLTEGSIAHFVLKEFFRRHRGKVLRRDALDTYTEEIRALVQQYYPVTATTKSVLHHNLLVLGRENLISILTKAIKEEVEWGEKTDGRFTPRYFELGFGGIKQDADANSTPQPLVLAAENSPSDQVPLKLWGKIDRVDTDRTGNFIVYDYKTGNSPTQAEIISGKRLQLPLYLLAVSHLFLPEGKPMGAAYYSLRQTNRQRGIWRQEAQAIGVKSRSVLPDEAWEETIENAVTVALQAYHSILQGAFPFCPPKQCPNYCDFRSICRQWN